MLLVLIGSDMLTLELQELVGVTFVPKIGLILGVFKVLKSMGVFKDYEPAFKRKIIT